MADFSTLPAVGSPPPNAAVSLDEWLMWREPSTGRVLRRTLLMLAAQDGSLPLMEATLLRGAAINLQSPDDGATALTSAAGSSVAPDAIKLLLQHGADRDLKDHAGRSALDIFLASGPFSTSPTQPPPPPPRQEQQQCVEEHRAHTPQDGAALHRASQDSSQSMESIMTAEAMAAQVHRDQDNTAFSSADFRIYKFKIQDCPKEVICQDHDWTECPFAHPGEKAKRRDPRKYQYTCAPCPDFRKGSCKRGDVCTYAHGVFEGWLHPQKYRTQMCKDGSGCTRIVCFFAHTPAELRVVPDADPELAPAATATLEDKKSPFGSGCTADSNSSSSSTAFSAADFSRASSDCNLICPVEKILDVQTPVAEPAKPKMFGSAPVHGRKAAVLDFPNSPIGHLDSGLSLSARSSVDVLRSSQTARASSSRSSSPACSGNRKSGNSSGSNSVKPRKSLQSSMLQAAQQLPTDRLFKIHQEQFQPMAASSQQQQQQQQQQQLRQLLQQQQLQQQLLQNQSWKLNAAHQAQEGLLSDLNLNLNVNHHQQQQQQRYMMSQGRASGPLPSCGIQMHDAQMMDLMRSASSVPSRSRMWQEASLPSQSVWDGPRMPAWPASLAGMDSLLHDQFLAAALMDVAPEPAGFDPGNLLQSELVSWMTAGPFAPPAVNSAPQLASRASDPFMFHSQAFDIGNMHSPSPGMYM